eukprot:scaffold220208_cov40-Cyclotella_meneghiniana.AAC.1
MDCLTSNWPGDHSVTTPHDTSRLLTTMLTTMLTTSSRLLTTMLTTHPDLLTTPHDNAHDIPRQDV